MSLPPRPTPTSWEAEIAAVAETFMNATANFYDPDTLVSVPYKPGPPESGGYDSPTLLFSSKARVQTLQAPRDPSDGIAFGTKRNIRIQIPLTATTMLVRKGLLVRVTDGGLDPQLTKLAFTVLSAVNGSHAAVRTVECVSELSEVPAIS